MLIEVLISLGTLSGPYNAGQVYDVADTLGTEWVAKGFARATTKPTTDHQALLDRLDGGAGRPCLFAPSFGEFGHRIMTAIRIVHWHKASRKVVCCKPGEEVLYPSAHEFVTDWTDPTNDAERGGTGPALSWPEIEARYPGYTLVQTGNLTRHPGDALHPCRRAHSLPPEAPRPQGGRVHRGPCPRLLPRKELSGMATGRRRHHRGRVHVRRDRPPAHHVRPCRPDLPSRRLPRHRRRNRVIGQLSSIRRDGHRHVAPCRHDRDQVTGVPPGMETEPRPARPHGGA